MKLCYVFTLYLVILFQITEITSQTGGPDPWNSGHGPGISEGPLHSKRKILDVKSSGGIGEWSFKRMLAIIMKPNRNKNIEDDSVEIQLQMKFSAEKWHILEEYLKSDTIFTEDMFRRTLGYVEEAIYKPTFKETIAMAWTDFILVYLTEYKMQIIWTLSSLAAIVALLRMWNKLTVKHLKIIAFMLLYLYEALISYMEAEQQEFQRFLSAVNSCKWYIWRSDCNVQSSDFITFWKYMNPAKIGIRMITNWISEPIVCLSSTINTITNDMTDRLWFPFNTIVSVTLSIGIYISIFLLVITVVLNYILNTPFNLRFFNGLGHISIPQHNRTVISNNTNDENQNIPNSNSIDRPTLNKILDICSHAVQSTPRSHIAGAPVFSASNNLPRIKRSASTGRLPITSESEPSEFLTSNHVRHRNI